MSVSGAVKIRLKPLVLDFSLEIPNPADKNLNLINAKMSTHSETLPRVERNIKSLSSKTTTPSYKRMSREKNESDFEEILAK